MLVLLINATYSQELVPPIQNYSPAEYSAASQNWDIALDNRGVIYSANNQGLLVFDGLSWELFSLESQSIIRSVYPHEGRIYTGSYKEFGYWETQEDGQMVYSSLTHLMSNYNMQSDEFWEIVAYKESIFFRSFGAVYKYEDNKISKVQEIVSTALEVFQNKLIMSISKNGLVYLDDKGSLESLEGNQENLENIDIIDIEAKGDTLYIGGKESLFTYYKGEVLPFWDDRLNKLLQKSELNHIVSISDNEIVLGTIKNGVITYNIKTGQLQNFNRTSGLQNNTVLGMAYNRGEVMVSFR